MKNTRFFFALSIVINLFFGVFYTKAIYLKYSKTENSIEIKKIEREKQQITYYLNRDELLNSMPINSTSIVFLGNSLTQYFPVEEMFNDLRIKNRGISGDVLKGVLKRLDPIIESTPKKIFIEIGINDLATRVSKDTIIKDYKNLINRIKNKSPNTSIYVQSIFPISNIREGISEKESKRINSDIIQLNNELKNMSKSKNFFFIDTYKYFVLDSELNRDFSVDGVHLSAKGYELWKNILVPYVAN